MHQLPRQQDAWQPVSSLVGVGCVASPLSHSAQWFDPRISPKLYLRLTVLFSATPIIPETFFLHNRIIHALWRENEAGQKDIEQFASFVKPIFLRRDDDWNEGFVAHYNKSRGTKPAGVISPENGGLDYAQFLDKHVAPRSKSYLYPLKKVEAQFRQSFAQASGWPQNRINEFIESVEAYSKALPRKEVLDDYFTDYSVKTYAETYCDLRTQEEIGKIRQQSLILNWSGILPSDDQHIQFKVNNLTYFPNGDYEVRSDPDIFSNIVRRLAAFGGSYDIDWSKIEGADWTTIAGIAGDKAAGRPFLEAKQKFLSPTTEVRLRSNYFDEYVDKGVDYLRFLEKEFPGNNKCHAEINVEGIASQTSKVASTAGATIGLTLEFMEGTYRSIAILLFTLSGSVLAISDLVTKVEQRRKAQVRIAEKGTIAQSLATRCPGQCPSTSRL